MSDSSKSMATTQPSTVKIQSIQQNLSPYGYKLTLKKVSQTVAVSAITIKRLYTQPTADKPNPIYDPNFPKPERMGRSIYIDSHEFYQWLSAKVGFSVVAPDKVLTAKQVRAIFDKSHTWIWQNINSEVLPKPFKIGRLNFWMASQFGTETSSYGKFQS